MSRRNAVNSGAAFFFFRPEEAGRPGGSPADSVVCHFDSWLGDDFVSAHPVFLVTTRLKNALQGILDAGTFTATRARTRRSRFFLSHHPGCRLPPFWSLHVEGTAGRDHMGVTADHSLVVSQRVLDVLVRFRVPRAVITQCVARG